MLGVNTKMLFCMHALKYIHFQLIEVLTILDEIKEMHVSPNEMSYTYAMRALNRAKRWSKVLNVFEEMQENEIPCRSGSHERASS
mmetsp:Transcript_3155/g.4003  ORF Transcript_3155/g.4003 Transcript_3155/m.4003 type:complete len:85 (-) Transcript_3155:468-722(-)